MNFGKKHSGVSGLGTWQFRGITEGAGRSSSSSGTHSSKSGGLGTYAFVQRGRGRTCHRLTTSEVNQIQAAGYTCHVFSLFTGIFEMPAYPED